jgi:hypothetical protein
LPDAREGREIVLFLEAGMSQDDRDRNFEIALNRHFRATCPDAETLAAYYESGLPSEEMLACKTHIASCSSCQEILAQLAASEKVISQSEAITVTEAQFAKSEAARLPVQTTGGVAARAKQMPRHFVRWRWAAPAGAIAAGLLVWVTLREMNHPAFVPQPPPPIAARSAPANPAANASEQSVKKSAPPGRATAALEYPAPEAKPLPETRKNTNEFAAKALPEISGQQASRIRAGAGEHGKRQIVAAPVRTAPKNPSSPSVSESVAVNAPAAAPAAPQMMINGATAPSAAPSPGPPTPQAAEDKTLAASGALVGGVNVPPTKEEERSNNLKERVLVRAADMVPWELVASPGAKALWHVGGNGSILHSVDKGAHWQAQSSGVTVSLSAGSAPTDQICWVVGQKGTILRTVDGGAHWEKISTPIFSDLGGVQAADAFHAKIWDSTHKQIYETSDAGATWKELPAQ